MQIKQNKHDGDCDGVRSWGSVVVVPNAEFRTLQMNLAMTIGPIFTVDSGAKERLMKKSDSLDENESAAQLVIAAESSAKRRDWNAADDLFRQAISLDPTPASRIAYGVCLSDQERFFEAISVFTPILESADRLAIRIVYHNFAAIYRTIGEMDLARRFQWQATLMQDDAGPEDLLAMANDALTSECLQAAESLAMTAGELQGDPAECVPDADILATTGLVHAALVSPEAGLLMIYAAYLLHLSESDFYRMGKDQLNMSVLFGELKRYRAERACLQRAIRYFEKTPAPYSLDRAKQLLDRFDRMRIVRSFNGRRN